MNKIILVLASLFLLTWNSQAQELNFTVRITTPQLQTADPKVFESLEDAMIQFLNSTKWTDDDYQPEERIKGNIQIVISEEQSETSFKADLSIQAYRPVYGSNYETLLINTVDKDVVFEYEQFQPIEYTQNAFRDNLSSILSFYVHVVLGMDYDTFSEFGGEEYFQKAQDITNTVPPDVASRYGGWTSLDGNRNRFWIIENILNPRTRPLRKANYDYHRLGLDLMESEPEKGRAVIADAINAIDQVNRAYPNAMILQLFANAKRDEIIEIFKASARNEQNKIIQIMSRVDPANANRYRTITK